jgi:hypothetical protein
MIYRRFPSCFNARGVLVVALLCIVSSVRAQSSNAFGIMAAGQTSHAGSGIGTGSLQDPGLISTSHTSAPAQSGFFTSGPGQSTTLTTSPGSTLVLSPSFTFAAPGNPFTNVVLPNESAISDSALFSPFELLRTGIPGDPVGRPTPGVGGTMDINGANHFDATVAPHWTLCRQSRYPVTVKLPIQVTVHEDPYYFGHDFGWFATGANISVPLSFIPRQFGKWSAGTSAELCYYGTTKTEFMNSIGLQIPKLGAAFSLQF